MVLVRNTLFQPLLQFYQMSSKWMHVYLQRCWSYSDHKVSIAKYCQGSKLQHCWIKTRGSCVRLLNLVFSPTKYYQYISKGIGFSAIRRFLLPNTVSGHNKKTKQKQKKKKKKKNGAPRFEGTQHSFSTSCTILLNIIYLSQRMLELGDHKVSIA